jgi:alkaline phosphatase
MFGELQSLDQAVATARRYAGENALIVVTGRQSLGGPVMNGYPFLRDKGISVIAMSNEGAPSVCWSTGPGFAPEPSPQPRLSKGTSERVGILSQPAAFIQPTASGTAGDVLCFGVGQGSEKIRGFLNLTDVHKVMSNAL